MTRLRFAPALLLFVTLIAGLAVEPLRAQWWHQRGPTQDGISPEPALPERWTPGGEGMAWRAPYGGRSTPLVIGNRVCLLNTAGRSTNWDEAEDVQERVMCLDARTGAVLWEHRYSIGITDVPPHRLAWASPAANPETGRLYSLGVAGTLVALSPEGAVVWQRNLVEEFGFVTTHGGRTSSPVVDSGLVIISGLMSGWGPWARGGNRWLAFDEDTGQTVWLSSPQPRHYDTNYSTAIVRELPSGVRALLVGGTDGAVHALEVATGNPIWRFDMTKRAVNTEVVMVGADAIVTHSEENLDTNEMGLVARIRTDGRGELGADAVRWRTLGWLGGFGSPVAVDDVIYHIDNGAVLAAFDAATGERLWTHELGTIQRGSLVYGDGKLYVGTENGKFFILRPSRSGVEVLDEDQLGATDDPEVIQTGVAVAHGRVYLVTDRATYAIGPAAPRASTTTAVRMGPRPGSPGPAVAAQVVPLETTVAPGGTVRFGVRLLDADGRRVEPSGPVTWALDGLGGAVAADGTFTAPASALGEAGAITATVGRLTASAQVRVIPPLPWAIDFEAHTGEAPPRQWINATGKFVVREVDGTRALYRLPDNTLTRRARLFMGASTWRDYTVEVDVRSTEARRQLGDVGIFAQRYGLILFGNNQRIELHPWQTARAMTVAAPFAWKADTWYRLKLRVQNQPDGTARVQGKVWPREAAEPAVWNVEKIDRIPHREGSPALYADAPAGAWFDNIRVTPHGR